mmetsp:Transcript_31881/g.78195  ORF Transcript_31881/g.78195 Transcript_31881/m.78195 type:complete len:173 (+) Transcript_31881:626-1144(+)
MISVLRPCNCNASCCIKVVFQHTLYSGRTYDTVEYVVERVNGPDRVVGRTSNVYLAVTLAGQVERAGREDRSQFLEACIEDLKKEILGIQKREQQQPQSSTVGFDTMFTVLSTMVSKVRRDNMALRKALMMQEDEVTKIRDASWEKGGRFDRETIKEVTRCILEGAGKHPQD